MKKYLLVSLILGSITSLFFLVKSNPQWFVKAPPPIIVETPVHYGENKIQVALILDTSNSMDGLIEQAKSQLWKLINELSDMEKDGKAPIVEIALYQYGNNHLSIRKGYTEQILPLTTDLDELSKQLFALTTNGGDEYCAWAINAATQELQWSANPADLKMIFIAGNENFNQGELDYKQVCAFAKNKGILINTIHCGDFQKGVLDSWQSGAETGGGRYMNINQNDEVVHFSTPYDDAILKLNQKLNRTYIGYGKRGQEKQQNQLMQDSNANHYSSANAVTRSFSKTKQTYVNDSWDLVDYSKKNNIGDLKADALPQKMRTMSMEEREGFIKEKQEERTKIKQQLVEYELKVKEYIEAKRKDTDGKLTLDHVMIETITEQAERKAFKKY